MLRARPWMDRSSRYVCGLCRRRLVPAAVTTTAQCHAHTDLNAAPRAFEAQASLQLNSHARPLTTTRSLRNTGAGGGSGFPGKFARGGPAAFGGFGVKKTSASDGPSQNGELLPHEREARERVAAANAASPPAAGDPANRSGSQARRHPRVRGGQRANAPGAELQEKADKSRSALADIFQKSQQNRRPRPLHHQRASKTGAGQEAEEADRPSEIAGGETQLGAGGPPAWGAFSKRQVTSLDTYSTSPLKDQSSSKSRGRAPSKARAGGPSPSGEGRPEDPDVGGVLDELSRSRRGAALSTRRAQSKGHSAEQEQDFWGQLEGRVDELTRKRRERQAASRIPPTPQPDDVRAEPPPDTDSQAQDEAEEPRRKSRFEVDESVNTRKRGKKAAHKNSRRSQWQEDDFDVDDGAARWDEIQRRKEEKKKRKLQQEMEKQAVPIFLPEFINVTSLARALKQSTDHFLADLEAMGFENMMPETIMTGETASLIAMEYGFDPTVDNGSQRDLRPRPPPEDVEALPPRPPIVTVMGHVDHGKTTLLDYLRKSSVAAQEHGGITQHIGAFVVNMSSGKPITFLDTPGHAAFLTMRQRGANVTDIVVLVVAADDSVKPQTLEALKHATNAKVPIIVAINKVDKEEARVEQVKADLSRHGIQIEDYGGDVQVVCVSGKTGLGMPDLEENIVTLSEILDTRAEQDGMAEGWVLESSVKQVGKVATVLVTRGTLRTGDYIAAGRSWARIRSLRNEAGAEVTHAPPSTPVEIIGWRDLPEAGEQVIQGADEDEVKTAIEYRQEIADRQESSAYLVEQEQRQREKEAKEAAEAAEAGAGAEGEQGSTAPDMITQNFVVKADVAGSVEAVCTTILEQGNNEVRSRVLRSGTGPISEYDVDHAATSGSILVNFNMAVQPHIKLRAAESGVHIIDHSVIYHLVDDARQALSDLLPKLVTHRVQGEADVLQIFPISIKGRKTRNVAGCRVRNGSIKRTSLVKVLRRGEVIYDGRIDTLRHVKKDVMEMGKGSECGIVFDDGFEDLEIDDQVQTYDIIEEKRQL